MMTKSDNILTEEKKTPHIRIIWDNQQPENVQVWIDGVKYVQKPRKNMIDNSVIDKELILE